jgi:hypothetical protein
VDGLQRSDLVVRQLFLHSDDEIDIAMGIKITNGKGALQVRADKHIAQGILNAGDQFFEDGVELRVRCPMIHRRALKLLRKMPLRGQHATWLNGLCPTGVRLFELPTTPRLEFISRHALPGSFPRRRSYSSSLRSRRNIPRLKKSSRVTSKPAAAHSVWRR